MPIVQAQGNTNDALPTGIVEVGIYSGPAGTLALVTSSDVPLTNLAAGCDVTLSEPSKYEIMLHYPGDADFQSTYSAKTKLHVYDGTLTTNVPTLGSPALFMLALLVLLAAMRLVPQRTVDADSLLLRSQLSDTVANRPAFTGKPFSSTTSSPLSCDGARARSAGPQCSPCRWRVEARYRRWRFHLSQ